MLIIVSINPVGGNGCAGGKYLQADLALQAEYWIASVVCQKVLCVWVVLMSGWAYCVDYTNTRKLTASQVKSLEVLK